MTTNTAIKEAMINANAKNTKKENVKKEENIKKENIDISNIDISSLDSNKLLDLMNKINQEAKNREEKDKNKFHEFINNKIEEINKWIEQNNPNNYYVEIKVSFEEKKEENIKKEENGNSKVAPKYKNLDGSKVWSGRGLSPLWISEILKQENITLDQFKKDSRFQIK